MLLLLMVLVCCHQDRFEEWRRRLEKRDISRAKLWEKRLGLNRKFRHMYLYKINLLSMEKDGEHETIPWKYTIKSHRIRETGTFTYMDG